MQDMKRFEAKNVEAAIEKACAYFQKDKDELEIEVIDSGSSGIFGLGGRNAAIQVQPAGDTNELESLVRTVVGRLLAPVLSDPQLEVRFDQDRINVTIEDEEYSGLIIGKEGQTIAAFEYMVNRIVAKSWPDRVYVQLDAGGYRQRQDDQVRQKALYLAQKVKDSGKAQSTKPMSSYHRRLVHMSLQDDTDIITRSKGEGPMKRVLITLKRRKEPEVSHQN
ncbi:MAG: RNA-binding cell elongation regulator Jag/EloR [Desulfovermiculus sp.]